MNTVESVETPITTPEPHPARLIPIKSGHFDLLSPGAKETLNHLLTNVDSLTLADISSLPVSSENDEFWLRVALVRVYRQRVYELFRELSRLPMFAEISAGIFCDLLPFVPKDSRPIVAVLEILGRFLPGYDRDYIEHKLEPYLRPEPVRAAA